MSPVTTHALIGRTPTGWTPQTHAEQWNSGHSRAVCDQGFRKDVTWHRVEGAQVTCRSCKRRLARRT